MEEYVKEEYSAVPPEMSYEASIPVPPVSNMRSSRVLFRSELVRVKDRVSRKPSVLIRRVRGASSCVW